MLTGGGLYALWRGAARLFRALGGSSGCEGALLAGVTRPGGGCGVGTCNAVLHIGKS